jgi:hypothetical protein
MGKGFGVWVTLGLGLAIASLASGQALAPVAVDDQYTVAQGAKLVVSPSSGLKANDANASSLSVMLHTGPTHGSLFCSTDGSFTYQPAADFAGYDSLRYDLVDGSRGVKTSASVQIKVARVSVAQVNLSKLQAVTGEAITANLMISNPGQTGGLEVPIAYVNCTGPASVTIDQGQTVVPFEVTAGLMSADQSASVIVDLGAQKVTKSFKIVAPKISSLSLSQSQIPGGTSVIGAVALCSAAGKGGVFVGLQGSLGSLRLPPAVFVPAGKTQASFVVPTIPVDADATGWVTARGQGAPTISVTVKSPRVAAISLPVATYLDQHFSGAVTLDSPSPATGTVVAISLVGATGPAKVVVLPGSTTAVFDAVASDTAQIQATATVLDSKSSASTPVVRPTVSTIDLPSSVAGGATVTGKVSLAWRAGPNGTVVNLSSNGLSGLPSAVTVQPGAKSASFTFTSPLLLTTTAYTVQAQAGGVSKSANLSVLANVQLSSLTLPSTATGGTQVTGTIALNTPALTYGFAVALSGITGLPTSVTVPNGKSLATFTFTAPSVSTTTIYKVQASAGSVTSQATLTVQPNIQLASVSVPSTVYSGNPFTGTVNLTMAAGTGGTMVTLSGTGLSGLPASVTVPEGQQSATFNATAPVVSLQTSFTVSAVAGGVTKTTSLTVQPLQLSALSAPTTVYGASTVTGTVTLNSTAGTGGFVVSLSGGNVSGLPSSVTVPAGQSSANFTFTVPDTSSQTLSLVIASGGGSTKFATLTVVPRLQISSLTVNDTSPTGGDTVKFTVQLSVAASAGAVTVTLASTNACVPLPGSVSVPQGSSSISFSVKTSSVSKNTSVSVTATTSGSSKNISMTVKK